MTDDDGLAGWWIIPFLVLGFVFWGWIISLVLP